MEETEDIDVFTVAMTYDEMIISIEEYDEMSYKAEMYDKIKRACKSESFTNSRISKLA